MITNRFSIVPPVAPLDERIVDLERQLFDHHDLPRIAQMMRADERTALESDLAELRRQRDHEADEPLDAA